MNTYRHDLNNLPFDPRVSESTVRLMKEYAKGQTAPTVRLHRVGRVALIAAVLTVALTVSVFAAVTLRTPHEVANYFGQTELAEAFKGEGAVIINQEQEVGDYIITLNGIVSGEGLEEYVDDCDASYAVLSVRYRDEAHPIPSGAEWDSDPIARFTVSPYVEGYAPHEMNLFTLESNAHKGAIDNVCYILLKTGSLEQFADKTVYLGVVGSDEIRHVIREGECPFSMDESGAIVKNAIAEELPCALFELPL